MFVSLAPERTFDHVADFRNAIWDPATAAARKTSEGPIGLGTTFELEARLPARRLRLPYTITEFRRPAHLVLQGETRLFRYRDLITVDEHERGSRLTYDADLSLKRPFGLANIVLRPVFGLLGRRATDGLKQSLDRLAAA